MDQSTPPGASRILLVNPATGAAYPAAPAGTVLRTSAGHDWRGLVAELHRLPAQRMGAHRLVGHRLIVGTGPGATPFGWRERGRLRETLFRPGDFALQTHGDTNAPCWGAPFEFLALALEPAFVARLVRDDLEPAAVEFVPRRGERDPVIADFAGRFLAELRAGNPRGPLYAGTLATAFALHLLTGHSVRGPGKTGRQVPRGRLSAFQLRRVVDLIQADLAGELPLESLAAAANVSPFHFARLFRRTVGLAPHQYVLHQRVDRAKALLRAPGRDRRPLAQVAVEAGFFDQAHLTHAFRRVTGTTPRRFADRSPSNRTH